MRPQATTAHLECRRRQAIQFWKRGKSLAAVARRVGAVKSSVWRWVQTYQQYGPRGLRAQSIPGRPSYLLEAQKTHLAQVLLQGARVAGYRTELWTLERIATVIRRQFQCPLPSPCACGISCGRWAGVVRNPSDAPVSATKRRLLSGGATAGRI